MSTITTVIPAKNEEKNIERCLKSVLWCDKVIVLWMGSDRTGEIAKSLGAEVVPLSETTWGKDDFIAVQKNINWAIDNIKTDWMLRIDADEVVTDELKKEIVAKTFEVFPSPDVTSGSSLTSKVNIVAYGIPRAQYFWGGFLKGGDWAYDRLVRLFRPKYCRYEPLVTVHEQFKVNGQVSYLKNKLLHYSHPTLKDAIDKFQKYTDIEINDLKETKISAALKMIFLPPYIFLRWMLWHQGWKDGLRGIIAGSFRGWYEYLLYFKYLKKKIK